MSLKAICPGSRGYFQLFSIASSSTGAHFEIRSIQELRKVHLWVPHGRGISLWLLRSTEALLLKNSPLSLFRLPLVPPVTPRHQPPSEKQLANILSSPSPKLHLISLDLGSGVPQYVVPWPYSGSIATAVPATGSPLSLSCTFFQSLFSELFIGEDLIVAKLPADSPTSNPPSMPPANEWRYGSAATLALRPLHPRALPARIGRKLVPVGASLRLSCP